MMTWLGAIKLGAQLLLTFMQYLQEKKLIEAGEAIAIERGLKQALEAVDAAIKAREEFKKKRETGEIGPDDDDGMRRD